MSHVYPPLVWSEGVFRAARKESDKLILELADGTVRYMNYQNWNETVQTTEARVFKLQPGAAIAIATWGGYDPTKWFCDVKTIPNPNEPKSHTTDVQLHAGLGLQRPLGDSQQEWDNRRRGTTTAA